MAVLAYSWNTFVGLNFALAAWIEVLIPAGIFSIALYYWLFRQEEVRLTEILAYAGMWFVFPIYAVKLTYLGLASGFPLQDALYSRWDEAIGFHWGEWASWVSRHPWLLKAQETAYLSSYWQPFVSIPVLAILAPRRNAQFLTEILLALVITVIGCSLLPAIGPKSYYGFDPFLADFVGKLRSADHPPVWYTGAVVFPSFHMAMAVLFIRAHRGLRTFWPFLALNLVMITAIPATGNHYLVDLVAGGLVALAAVLVTKALPKAA
jgi:hypothetical protein